MNDIRRSDLVELDNKDTLAPFREKFQLREGLIYLDGNSLGPLPRAVVPRLTEALTEEWGEGLITSWLGADWVNAPTRIGDKIATLIGAQPGEVVVADSTSVNIFKALGAACSINDKRRVILSESKNFPTDIYMMQGLEAFTRNRISARVVPGEEVLDHIDDDVAALLLTQVHYKTGDIRDMEEVTRKAQAAGVLTIWDLSHSAGSIPVNLTGANADFAVGCTYKFLNGGPGAPAYIYVAKRHQKKAQPVLAGWFGHAAPFAFDDRYQPAEGVTRFLCGTPPILGMTALEPAIDLFCQADMAAVRDKAIRLGDLFIDLMGSRCGEFGFKLISPRDGSRRGSQVSYKHENGYEIMQALKARDVVGDFRSPDVLRFGMTPLYLRYQDIYDAVDILCEIMASRSWDKPEYKTRASVT